jgi:hypothetical protein
MPEWDLRATTQPAPHVASPALWADLGRGFSLGARDLCVEVDLATFEGWLRYHFDATAIGTLEARNVLALVWPLIKDRGGTRN